MLHKNVIPPEAVNVTGSPGQMGGTTQMIAHIGAGFTVTVTEQDEVHPLASVTVTVYVVVDAGLTVMAAVVAALLHRNDVPPEAVSVTEPFGHTEGLAGAMLQTGAGFTVTVTEQDEVHPLASVTVTV